VDRVARFSAVSVEDQNHDSARRVAVALSSAILKLFRQWSGNNSYNTPANCNHGGAVDQPYFRGSDFPVLNLHAHVCFLYSASKLLGLEFDEAGPRLNLNLPENEYRFDSPLFGEVKTHDRFEGWYKPSRPGTWTIRILLEKDAPPRLGRPK
jgi:hypothetical protein